VTAEAPTRDTLLAGELVLWQPPRGAGYRFNLDPVLLSSFVLPTEHLLDLGAGCGVLGLLLLRLCKARAVTAVEVQPTLAALAKQNGQENGFGSAYAVLTGDLRHLSLPAVTAVAFNPPYFRADSGHLPPELGRRVGRYETHGALDDFVRVAAAAVGSRGPVSGVLPMQRERDLLRALHKSDLTLTRRREIRARIQAAPRFMLWEARAAACACVVEPPLVVHEESGRAYSGEVRALLRE